MAEFQGFPRGIIKFFDQLKKNNNKEWFEANRKDYIDLVKAPSELFVVAMGEKLRKISPSINAIPKVNQSLFRLNRDTRFSPDKSPYKTNMGILFWEGGRKRMECTGFYFHLEGRNLMLAAGMHMIPRDLLASYRDAVVDKKNSTKLVRAANTVIKSGYSIGGKHYKKVPRGYNPSHRNAEYLLHNGLFARVEEKIPKAFHSGALVEHAFAHYKKMSPIHKWLMGALFA